jgi:short subunit dehydrogenase-like uncharacterized protein
MSTQYDVILYGATSFVGQITAKYLAQYDGEAFTWAIAGRSLDKLNRLKDQLQLPQLTCFVADSADEQALTEMAKHAKVIITTVGPYALYGETLVKVCATTGTDYCDLTGEPQWIKAMLDKYEALATSTGARIIHTAGFDSIPSDLGVWAMQQDALASTGKPIKHIKMRVHKVKGAASGGTVASMLNVMSDVGKDKSLRKVLVNPYVLCPSDHPYHIRQTNHTKAQFEPDTKMWIMPFVMAAINERIVHRTNALLAHQYGDDFRYDEAMRAKSGGQAWGMTLGLGAFMLGASVGALRKLMTNTFLPKPGEGPSEQAQTAGMYDMRFYGVTCDGQELVYQVIGDRDPGYGSTAKMLAQVGLCLAKDVDELQGGCWTPAAGLGSKLQHRLAAHAGVVVQRKLKAEE